LSIVYSTDEGSKIHIEIVAAIKKVKTNTNHLVPILKEKIQLYTKNI
jgi:hypothetical protein